jgi:hypothetical protein
MPDVLGDLTPSTPTSPLGSFTLRQCFEEEQAITGDHGTSVLSCVGVTFQPSHEGSQHSIHNIHSAGKYFNSTPVRPCGVRALQLREK